LTGSGRGRERPRRRTRGDRRGGSSAVYSGSKGNSSSFDAIQSAVITSAVTRTWDGRPRLTSANLLSCCGPPTSPVAHRSRAVRACSHTPVPARSPRSRTSATSPGVDGTPWCPPTTQAIWAAVPRNSAEREVQLVGQPPPHGVLPNELVAHPRSLRIVAGRLPHAPAAANVTNVADPPPTACRRVEHRSDLIEAQPNHVSRSWRT
jgi:hypothetical protein